MDHDITLLRHYERSRDADAFTTLVRRHSAMVFGRKAHFLETPIHQLSP